MDHLKCGVDRRRFLGTISPQGADANGSDEAPCFVASHACSASRSQRPAMGWQRRRRVDRLEYSYALEFIGLSCDINGMSFQVHPCPRAVPKNTRWAVQHIERELRIRITCNEPLRHRRFRVGAQHNLSNGPKRSKGAGDQLREVEAAYVLYNGSTGGNKSPFR